MTSKYSELVNITDWIPKFVADVINDKAGMAVDYEYWNSLWNKQITQGDYNSMSIHEILAELYNTVWHSTDGATSIAHPAIQVNGETADNNVGALLDWLTAKWSETYPLTLDNGASALKNSTTIGASNIVAEQLSYLNTQVANARMKNVAITHGELSGSDGIDLHPITAIAGLEERLQGIQAGSLEEVAHNLLPDRDLPDAHPISAITDLAYTLSGHTNSIAVINQDIADIRTTIAAISGNVESISHNDLTGRDVASAHPMSAITGLSDALGLKLASATAASTYQRKVLSGTTAPAAGLGSDGDIYIRVG